MSTEYTTVSYETVLFTVQPTIMSQPAPLHAGLS